MNLENVLLRGRRVLVADDEFLIAAFLKEMIEETGAVVIGPAYNIADAMKLAESEEIDAAFLDVNLGGKQSFPVAAGLRARGIQVAFLTGMDSRSLPAEFSGVGVLTKPVSIEALIATLEAFFHA